MDDKPTDFEEDSLEYSNNIDVIRPRVIVIEHGSPNSTAILRRLRTAGIGAAIIASQSDVFRSETELPDLSKLESRMPTALSVYDYPFIGGNRKERRAQGINKKKKRWK